jgi:glycosyltransferase involved in cell wall biosynthesis
MEFWIVGDAVMGNEEEKYKKKILSLIEKYKLSDKIKMFGFVNNPIEYMKNIDVLVLPSIYPEPFGRVVVEAMLLKKVVIATEMGGVTEIIKHKEEGILVGIENLSQNIAQWIIRLYNDKNLYTKLSEQGYKKALNNFTEEKMLKQIDQFIRNLK